MLSILRYGWEDLLLGRAWRCSKISLVDTFPCIHTTSIPLVEKSSFEMRPMVCVTLRDTRYQYLVHGTSTRDQCMVRARQVRAREGDTHNATRQGVLTQQLIYPVHTQPGTGTRYQVSGTKVPLITRHQSDNDRYIMLALTKMVFFCGLSLLIIARNFIALAESSLLAPPSTPSSAPSSSCPLPSSSPPAACLTTAPSSPAETTALELLPLRSTFAPALAISFSRSSLKRPVLSPPEAFDDMGRNAPRGKTLVLVHLEGAASDRGVCVVSAAVAERIADARGPREVVVIMTRRREDCTGEDIQLAMAVLARYVF